VRDRGAFARSVAALACGALVLGLLQTWLPRLGSRLGGGGWPLGVACAVLAGAAAGGLAARLAPSRPYAHALGLALASTFLWLAFALLFLAVYEGRVTHSVATYAWYLPALCSGAWLGARVATPAAPAPPPSPA
jgi:hypothetical protein